MLGASQAALLGCATSLNHPAYADMVTALRPVAYWHLGEVGGNTIIDEEAVQPGTYVGTIEFGVEPIVGDNTGTAVGFNGTSAYGEIPHNAAFAVPNGTIAFAVQADSVSGQRMLLAKDAGLPIGGFTVDINNGRLRAYLRNGSGVAVWLPDPAGAADVEAGIAYHVALTWGGRGAELWLDGTLIASNPGLGVGLGSNTASLFIAAYPGPTAFADVVMDEIAWFDRQLVPAQIRSLAKPRTITRVGPAGVGIQLPNFDPLSISDSVPGGAIWWDPTNGSDGGGNNGSTKALAKKTFAAAQSAVSAGGTIVVAGGSAGSTTYHAVPQIAPTKSGSSGNPITMMAEPDRIVYLVPTSEAVWIGALARTWTWTLIDGAKKIWESPALGITDGATTVSQSTSGDTHVAAGNNWLCGIIKIPNGPKNRPYFLRAPYASTSTIANPDLGDEPYNSYAHPVVTMMGNGKIRIRMQKPTVNYAGDEWPTAGEMGGLIDSTGKWAEPATENPNDYEIHLCRWGGDFGSSGPTMFNFNAVSNWTVKGLNFALCNRLADGTNSNNITFDRCVGYLHWSGVRYFDGTANWTFDRCKLITGDVRHMDWSVLKNGGYYFQHMRSTPLFSDSTNATSRAHNGALFQDCLVAHWFDGLLPAKNGGPITIDHCAWLYNIDDGCQFPPAGAAVVLTIRYTYWCGVLTGDEGGSSGQYGQTVWPIHHNVIDHRIPILWSAYANTDRTGRLAMNPLYTGHGYTGSTPFQPRSFCYNTVIVSAGARGEDGVCCLELGPSIDGHNITGVSTIHSVFNNIFVVSNSRRWPHGRNIDHLSRCMSCKQSVAGWQRFDYNCYDRTHLPDAPVSSAFTLVQDSSGANHANYSSLAAFRTSAHKTTSLSMYTDGTDGHEAHGVQVDPGFVNLVALDYRPTHASAISGAKDVTSLIGGAFENWKGALDPAGDGSEVGPRNP